MPNGVPIDYRDHADTNYTVGVGDGYSRLFFHSEHDSIKAVQRIALEREELRAHAERLAEALDDVAQVASEAMRQANNDGAEYDIDDHLAEARAALSAYNHAKGEA